MLNIFLEKIDIANMHVDVIVNAAKPSLLGGSGVDGSIHRAAGSELVEACKKLPIKNGTRCPASESRATSAYNLNAKYVVHAVGPIYGQSKDPQLLLQKTYRSALRLSIDLGCNTVALPSISTGKYAYPLEEAASIALQVCCEEEFAKLVINFCFIDDYPLHVFRKELKKLKELAR